MIPPRASHATSSPSATPAGDPATGASLPAASFRETAAAAVADSTGGAPDELGQLAPVADAAAGRAAERALPHATAHPLPPHLGRHLAETVASFPDRPVELILSPEELGRVRMTLSTEGGSLALAIQADRPETIDLMRRHIDQLAQDFRDLGFTDISFSFGQGDTAPGTGQPADESARPPAETDVSAPDPRPVAPGRTFRGTPEGGLDLRL